MEKTILEALSKLLPEETVKEVASAVEEMLSEAKKSLEAEYNQKLEEAYAELSKELKDAEQTAETGYQEAYNIIQDLRNRLEVQKTEFESTMEENYEEAYQMIVAEREKNKELETELYKVFEGKVHEIQESMIDKVDQFLQYKGHELYEQARRDILNDPNMLEHKVALDKIVDTVANYISDEDYSAATSKKLEEAHKNIEDLKAQVRLVEARNIRISTENQKLNEAVKHGQEVIKEQKAVSVNENRNERLEKAKNAEGRGKKVTDKELIAEFNNPQAQSEENADATLVEGIDALDEIKILAGVKKN